MGLQVVAADLLGEGDIVRHDPRAAAQVMLELARRGRAAPLTRSASSGAR